MNRIIADFLGDSYTTVSAIPHKQPVESESKPLSHLDNGKEGASPVHYADLYNALRYALYHEVLLHKSYNASQVDALHRFFSVLNQYFPFDNENPRRFVKRMAQWMGERNATQATDLHAIMRAGSEGYLPTMRPYVACYSKTDSKRGYPCGLWLLFHTLVASEYSKARPDSKVADYHSVLFAMRAYISNFFVCKYCAQEFAEITANLETDLKYPNSSVLWLWNAHNQVNRRLAGDITEDPDQPKIQFPSAMACPECFMSSKEWDRRGVLNYLLNHYHRANILKSPSTTATPYVKLILVMVVMSATAFR